MHNPIQPTTTPLLTVDNISVRFGGLLAVGGVNFDLRPGEIVGLIGPNGAGKTTVFNLLTGVYTPTSGTITLDNHSIGGLPPHRIVKYGMARTFQNIRLFKHMTILDNVRLGFQNHADYGLLSTLFRGPAYRREEERFTRKALELLEIFDLADAADLFADHLPYGAQRRLEICRALATQPKILLLDEPAAGMNPSETNRLIEAIKLARDRFGIAILLIEHDMNLVMGVCERLIVLNYGRIIATGSGDEVRRNPDVIRAYLGSEGLSEEDEMYEQAEESMATTKKRRKGKQ